MAEPDNGQHESNSPPDTKTIYVQKNESLLGTDDVVLDRYIIAELIGRGNFGNVYKAFDTRLDKDVALKFLRTGPALNPKYLRNFLREVTVAQDLSHPNLCRIYDLFEDQGKLFFSMEYLKGWNLQQHLNNRGNLPLAEVIYIMSKLCEGLSTLHGKSIVHRDLKPSNIVISEVEERIASSLEKPLSYQVCLTDFGLSDYLSKIEGGVIAGTIPYIAPEILNGRTATIQSDIFSLGAILYELLTNRKAFESIESILERTDQILEIIQKGPPHPSSFGLEIDNYPSTLINDCLAHDPKNRPSSVFQILSRLKPRSIKIDSGQWRDHREVQSPFVFGRSVIGEEFIGRRDELKKIFSALLRGMSVLLVGEISSGKSSMLLKIQDEFRTNYDGITVKWIDLQGLPDDYSPRDFWEEVLSDCSGRKYEEPINQALARANDRGYEFRSLQMLFRKFVENENRFIILVDDFDELLDHENFDTTFFNQMRSLVCNSGLTVSFACRFSAKRMEAEDWFREVASRNFAHLLEVELMPYRRGDITSLLESAGNILEEKERNFIENVAGRHPMLLQVAATFTFVNKLSKTSRLGIVFEIYRQILPFFRNLWQCWDDNNRVVAGVIGMCALLNMYEEDNSEDYLLARKGTLRHELACFEHLGLIRKPREMNVSEGQWELLDIGSAKWVVDSAIFIIWLFDIFIFNENKPPGFDEWRKGDGIEEFVEKETWNRMKTEAMNLIRGNDECIEDLVARLVERNWI